MRKTVQVAIDGPVAAGKGTVARLVAARLGYLYVDTGAMYRTAALLGIRNKVALEDEVVIVELVQKADIDLRQPEGEEKDGRLITVLLDGEDISWKIRTEEVSAGASVVAKMAKVRQELVRKQQAIASEQNVVMEGRDITFRVLPEANLKIYLTASAEERAARRHKELLMRGEDVTIDSVLADLEARDKQDMERAVDPLQIVEDAWVLDTTGMTIEGVVDLIVKKLEDSK